MKTTFNRLLLIVAMLAILIGVNVLVVSCGPAGDSVRASAGARAAMTLPKDRVIEVVDRIPGNRWDVRAAMTWLDRYTASDMRMSARCSGRAYRCLTVQSGALPGRIVGKLSGNVITIDTVKANKRGPYRNYYRVKAHRISLLAHEFGHAHGLKHHGGRNLMNPTAGRCSLILTAAQRTHLRGR